MANVRELKIISTGFLGAPGYTTLHFEESLTHTADLQFSAAKDFLDGMASTFITTWSATLQPEFKVYDDATGEVLSVEFNATGSGVAVTGTQSGAQAAGMAGVCIGWRTASVNRNRIVQGRTFFVPAAQVELGTDGQLTTGATAQNASLAAELVAADVGFSIWSRPRSNGATPPVYSGGKICKVTGGNVKRTCATLRSRRT